ncbi:MAG TPA: F0F1 ATP synthase subunit epsilon [Mycobacteriales bacterium]|nr:F0F1 ATP synthase subunit epsilon [Mycobacteriales bacterium]
MHVEVVAVDRNVYSGDATMVVARTTEGEIGVLPGHTPLLGELAEGGVVTIRETGGGEVVAAVHGGFLSITDEGVTILAEVAEMAADIDTSRAQSALERARSEGDEAAARRAEGRLRAAGQPA